MLEHLPDIEVRTIPHRRQKYDTAGDYYDARGAWNVRLSQLPDWRYEGLVLIHELVEMLLTKHAKVSWIDIDEFDRFGEGKDHPDPGTLESAPYYIQHKQATFIEQQLAQLLDVNWQEYDKALDELVYKEK